MILTAIALMTAMLANEKPIVPPVPPLLPDVPQVSTTPWSSFDESYRCTIERSFGAKPGTVAMKLGRTAFSYEDGQIILRGAPRLKQGDYASFKFDDGPEIAAYTRITELPRVKITVLQVSNWDKAFWSEFRGAQSLRIPSAAGRSLRSL
ncbi:MAG: hypothetical protein V4659_10040 [Pseudomonadota bacterium]